MKRKAIIPLVLGLGIGLLAVKFGVDAIRKAQASGKPQNTVTVIQAKVDIDATAEIRPDMIESTQMVESPLIPPAEHLGEADKVVGRVTAKFIAKGSPVLASMLAPPGTSPGLAGRIPPGYRAYAVKIDEQSSASYGIKSGDWVDVIVVMDVETGRRKKETVAEVILQHIEVASVGYGNQPAESDKNLTKVKPAKSATLLVTEEELPKLHLAGTRGKISLAMRGDDDSISDAPLTTRGADLGGIFKYLKGEDSEPANSAPPSATEDDLFGSGLAAHPLQEPHPVMIVRGATIAQPGAMESITFENSHSAKILAVNIGAPSQAAGLIRQQNVRAPRPQQETPQRGPANQPMPGGDVSDKDEGNSEPAVEETGDNEG